MAWFCRSLTSQVSTLTITFYNNEERQKQAFFGNHGFKQLWHLNRKKLLFAQYEGTHFLKLQVMRRFMFAAFIFLTRMLATVALLLRVLDSLEV